LIGAGKNWAFNETAEIIAAVDHGLQGFQIGGDHIERFLLIGQTIESCGVTRR
jgi:hypothetical protein